MSDARPVPSWDFDYAPIPIGGGDDGRAERDLVLATADDVDTAQIAELLAGVVPDVAVTPLFSGHPIFWTRVESSQPIDRERLEQKLTAAGKGVRFIASSRRGSQRLPPPLACVDSRSRRASGWKTRGETSGLEPASPWRWFLREEGVDVLRSTCGTGAGTRLAVVDNDGRDLDKVELDAEVLVGAESVPRASAHAALLIGWAVGARTEGGLRFRGVAPDASVRVYCIPKGSDEVISLPLAIVRAVEDGADVVVCATYLEGQTSPLLDDALEFAARLGRNGKGTAVVLPTGREMSSPPGSIHSSLSLGMADPASDPRVFCIGPSARSGGWFLWRDRQGRLRPFANRGPAVRWLAPGDDMAYPFASDDRPAHAESSGASGVAAGVLLLTMARNAALTLSEIDTLLSWTATPVDPTPQASDTGLADPEDLLPLGRDLDGHNAKHGYGRLNAATACLAACDPLALALVRIGERTAAIRYVERIEREDMPRPYSRALARWASRIALTDARVGHALAAAARAYRLASLHPERERLQPLGHLLKHVAFGVRLLLGAAPAPEHAAELLEIEQRLRRLPESDAGQASNDVLALSAALFATEGSQNQAEAATASSVRHGSAPRVVVDRRTG